MTACTAMVALLAAGGLVFGLAWALATGIGVALGSALLLAYAAWQDRRPL